MLKLTLEQIKQARCAASAIGPLEDAKDHHAKRGVYCEVEGVQLLVPHALVRAELDRQIADAHAVLRGLGIELLPG